PLAHDTAMVTVLAAVVNTTRAVVAGPRATPLAVKPCCGLHDSKKAPPGAHWATTVPPAELSTVPPALATRAGPPALARDRGAAAAGARAAPWAWAWAAAAALGWPPAGEAEIPAPSSDITSSPPAVAPAPPGTHAPPPIPL